MRVHIEIIKHVKNAVPTHNKHIFVRPKNVLIRGKVLIWGKVLILGTGRFRILGIDYKLLPKIA